MTPWTTRHWFPRPGNPEAVVLLIGIFFSTLAGVVAYRVDGPYGDGPFGAGFRRIPDASAAGRSILVHDFLVGTQAFRAVIDEQRGRAVELRFSAVGDSTGENRLFLEETGGVRLPRDLDGDGLADRWDYYAGLGGMESGVAEKVGFSLAGDGVIDTWAFHDDEGRVSRVEVSTGRDGVVDRWEHYDAGVLVRVETDADRDGRVDGWSTYVDGILSTTAADADGDGAPDPPAPVRR